MQPQPVQKLGPEAAPISSSAMIVAPLGSSARTPSTTPARTNMNQPTLSLAETGVGFASLVLPTANTKERFITAVSTDLNTPDIKIEDFLGGKGFQQNDNSKPGVVSHPKGEVAARPLLSGPLSSDQTTYLDLSPVSQEFVDGESQFINVTPATPTPEVDDNMEIEEDTNLLLNVNFPEIYGVEKILKEIETKTYSPTCVTENDLSIHSNALIHDTDPMLSASNNCMAPLPVLYQLPSRERQQQISLTEINSRPLTNTGVVDSGMAFWCESADTRLHTNLTGVADSRAPPSALDISKIACGVLPGNSNKPTNSEEFGKDDADMLQQLLQENDIQFDHDSFILQPTAPVHTSTNETLVPLGDGTFLVYPASSGPHLQPSASSSVPLFVQPSTSAGLLPALAQQQQILYPNLSSDPVNQEEVVSTNCRFGATVEVVDASDQIKVQSLLNNSTAKSRQIFHANTTLSTGGQSIQSLISPSTVFYQPNRNATPGIQEQMNNHTIPNAQNILYATTPSVPMTEQQVNINTNFSLNSSNQTIQLVLNSPAPHPIRLQNAPSIVQAPAKRLGKQKSEVKNDRTQNMIQVVHPYDLSTTFQEVHRGMGPVRTRRRAARKPLKLTEDYILNETSNEVTDVEIVSSLNPTASHTRLPSTSPFTDPQVSSTNLNSVNDPDIFSDREEPSTSSGKRRRKVNIKDLTDEQKYRWTRKLNNDASKRCREKRKSNITVLEAEEEILKEKNNKLRQELTQITQRRDRIRALFDLYKNALLRNQAPR